MRPLIARLRGSYADGGCTTPVERDDRLSRTVGALLLIAHPRSEYIALAALRGSRPTSGGPLAFSRSVSQSGSCPNGGELGRQCSDPLDRRVRNAYHCGMRGASAYWTLVFTAASLEHLAERNVEAADVTGAVYGRHGPVRVRRGGRGGRERWFVVAPLESGELLTCVFRVARPRDLDSEGAFVVSSTGRQQPPGKFDAPLRQRSSGGRGRGKELPPVARR